MDREYIGTPKWPAVPTQDELLQKIHQAINEAEATNVSKADMVNHPPHYTSHPSGVECIQITEHMGFNLGNALKYIWRADLKHNAIEDMKKAVFYINREIEKREGKGAN